MIRPLENRLVIRPLPQERRSEVLEVPDETTTFSYRNPNKPAVAVVRGTVLAVGPGKADKKGRVRPVDVPVGAVVRFSDSCSRPFTIGGESIVLIREDDVAYIEE